MASRPLSSTKALWRLPFGHYSESDTVNRIQRQHILSRDDNTCCDCKLKLARHMEVRHLDENHDNDQDSNLACICPFCHLRDHLGPTGFASAGTIVGAPTLTQGQINSLSLAIWYIQARVTSTADIRKEPARLDPDNEETSMQRLLELSMGIWKDLSISSVKFAPVFSARITEPDVLGGILNELHETSPDTYAKREALLAGLHILPSREAFGVQCMTWFDEFDRTRPISSWRKGLESFLVRTETSADELLSELDTPPPPVNPTTELLGRPLGPDSESDESQGRIRRTGGRYE